MSELYKKTFRGYLIDHHSPDPPIVTLENINVDEYEQFFKEANISNLMVYCKDHWGVTYYDSKYGKKHPGLKEDWIKQIAPVLKKNNIEFMAYYCLEYDTYAPKAHPEWCIRKADGTPRKCGSPIAKWGMPCYETEYREYALNQLKEIVSRYKPDSLFLDIFGKSLCYCPSCMSKFKKIYGYDLPKDEKELLKVNKDVIEFLDNCAKEMLQDIISNLKAIDPQLKITINFASLYNKEIRDMLDFQFTEPWAGNWLSAAYARDTAINQYPQLGPGDVSEVYNYKHDNIYELAAAKIAAQGCRVFMYSGSQHPDGTLEHTEAKKVGNAYKEIEKIEQYLSDREVIADIGVMQSDYSSKLVNSEVVVANAIGRVKKNSKHRDSLLGAMKLCDYSKYTWKVIPEQQVTFENIKDLKMLILPNIFYVSEQLKQELIKYVEHGGILLTDCETGLYDLHGNIKDNYELSNINGIKLLNKEQKYADNPWSGYLKFDDDFKSKSLANTYPPVSDIRFDVENINGDIIAKFMEPATELTDEKWVNWWCPPPSKCEDKPAVVVNTFGKGKVIYCAFDVFTMKNGDFNWINDFAINIFNQYISDKKVFLNTDYPNIVKFVGYDRAKYNDIIVHQVSEMPALTEGEAPQIDGGKLYISKQYKQVKKALIVYPYEKELNVEEVDEYYVIDIPDFNMHQIVQVKY